MPEEDTLPDREFDNHEVYPLMERLVADAVAVLPDFPGFFERRGTLQSCTDERGDAIEGWVSIELNYTFDEATSQTEQVREQYTDVLREAWTEAGYEITWDEASPTGQDYNLEAARSDGITLWWRVWGLTVLTVQSGCVPIGEGGEKPEYIAPAGGVLPQNDPFGNSLDPSVYGDEASSETETDEAAVDPFAGAQAHGASMPFEPPAPYDGQL